MQIEALVRDFDNKIHEIIGEILDETADEELEFVFPVIIGILSSFQLKLSQLYNCTTWDDDGALHEFIMQLMEARNKYNGEGG